MWHVFRGGYYMVLHGSGGGRANWTSQIRAEQLFTAAINQ